MRLREGISWGTKPDGCALPVSPRYQTERSMICLFGNTEGPRGFVGPSAFWVVRPSGGSSVAHTSSTVRVALVPRAFSVAADVKILVVGRWDIPNLGHLA